MTELIFELLPTTGKTKVQSKCKNINYLLKLKHLVVTGTESQSPQINIQNINNTIQKHLAHKEPEYYN